MALEQPQRSVDGAPVHAGIDSLRLAQNLARVQMLAGGFHHAQNRATLLRHPDSALGKVSLEPAWHFCFRKRHQHILILSQVVALRVRPILPPAMYTFSPLPP